jgi:hypothetical protein
MPTESEQKKEQGVNWNYVIIGGLVLGGGYLLYKAVTSLGTVPPENTEKAKAIMDDWQQEFDQVKRLLDSIQAEGRTPTDNEVEIISNFQDQMKIKEMTIYNLDQTVWQQLQNAIWQIAKSLGVSVGTIVVAYGAIKLINAIIDKYFPPRGGFPCPTGDGFVARTTAELDQHIKTAHTVATVNLLAAQQMYIQLPTAVQNYINQTSTYNASNIDWSKVSVYVLIGVAVAAGICLAVFTVGAAAPISAGEISAAFAMAFV